MKPPRGGYLGGAVVPVHAVFVWGLAFVWFCHGVGGQTLSGCTASVCRTALQNCGASVAVDSQAGQNCSQAVQAGATISGQVCNSLQDVLNSIAANATTHPLGDCISVDLTPGDYVITSAITITQNVALRGVFGPLAVDPNLDVCILATDIDPAQPPANVKRQANMPPPPSDPTDPNDCTSDATFADLFQVRVTFDLRKPPTADPQDPYYAVVFTGSDAVAVSGIMFSDSSGILGFENISFVSVDNCSFSYFLEGAVDMYNCGTVEVDSCSFAHNGPADVLKSQMYRGHSPALSIAYNYDSDSTVAPIATVTNSVFYNNTGGTALEIFSTTQLLQQLLFPGRGGGLAIIANSLVAIDVLVGDCLMQENSAENYGGGMYTLLDGLSNHVITVNRSRFIRNTTPGTSGGLHMGFREEGTSEFTNSLFIYDCIFRGNEADFGGGVFFLHIGQGTDGDLGNFAAIENCEFTDNTAGNFSAAFGAISANPFVNRENTKPLQITNCTFLRNTVREAGVVGTAYFPIAFYGDNLFEENRGSSLVILSAVVKVFGHITFFNNNNNGIDGGALYVTSLGQLLLHPGAGMTFNNNSGGLGAAIVVETPQNIPSVYSSLVYNPLCTLLFNDSTLSPLLWHDANVTLNFLGNTAIVGSAVYLNNLRLCSWTQLAPPYFSNEGVFRWDFVEFSENENSAYPDQFNELWYVQTPARELNITSFVQGYPGEMLELEFTALDELDRETAAVVRLSDESTANFMGNPTSVEYYRFVPSAITYDRIQSGLLNTSFVQQDSGGQRLETILVESVINYGPAGTMMTFEVSALGCPPGYILDQAAVSGYLTCSCHFDNADIVNCDGRSIVVNDNLWGTAGRRDPLVVYPCPFGYCRCFPNMPAAPKDSCAFVATGGSFDDQCSCGRQGLLCGGCREDKGVSVLTNSCVSCHNASGALILMLIVLDALVFLGLLTLFLKVPFPSLFYPCIFYLQILPYLTEYFPTTFDKFRPYLHYVSSATGFYFPYDFCLYHSMNPLVSYTLRYIPLFLAAIIAPIVLVIRRYKFHPVPWHGLWWIVLLLYTPLLHTSMSLLNCPRIPDKARNRVSRWFIDANIKCFAYGGHAPLGLLAIAAIILCVLLIPVAVLFSMGKIQNPRWPHHLVDPLTWGFKKKFPWWTAVELGRRIALVVTIIAFPNNDYPAIFVICFFLAMFGLLQPHKSLFANILEMVLSADVLIMLLFRNTDHLQEIYQVLPRQTPSDTSSSDCNDHIRGVTTMSWILAIFYYLPLLVTVGMVVLWGVRSFRDWWKDEKQKQLHSANRDESIANIAKPPMTTVVDLTELVLSSPVEPGAETVVKGERCTTSVITIEELDRSSDEEGDYHKGGSNKHKAVQKVKSAPPVVSRTQMENDNKVADEQELEV